jgi:hypothetical protein
MVWQTMLPCRVVVKFSSEYCVLRFWWDAEDEDDEDELLEDDDGKEEETERAGTS